MEKLESDVKQALMDAIRFQSAYENEAFVFNGFYIKQIIRDSGKVTLLLSNIPGLKTSEIGEILPSDIVIVVDPKD